MLYLIKGRSGTGKSQYILQKLKKELDNDKYCIMIVPDQATHETEQKIMGFLGNGLMNVEVLSFSRLASRVLSEQGGLNKTFLDDNGKLMVLRKIIAKKQKELEYYSKAALKPGFAKKMQDVINILKFNMIEPNAISNANETIKDLILDKKLKDIACIYQAMEEYLANGYQDEQDRLNLLIEKMHLSKFIKDAAIFVDGFNFFDFNSANYKVLETIIKHAQDVYVTFCFNKMSDDDFEIFRSELNAFKRLKQFSDDNNISYKMIGAQKSSFNIKGMETLESELFSYTKNDKADCEFKLYEAISQKHEVEYAVDIVASMLEKGIKLKDITIVAGDIDDYIPILRRELSINGLGFFIDEGRKLSTYNAVEYILASIDAAVSKSVDDVMRVAKSGFSVLDIEQVQKLENYALVFGIKYSGFFKEFVWSDETDEQMKELAEDARKKLIEPILNLREKTRRVKDVNTLAKIVYEYMQETQLKEQIETLCNQLLEDGEYELASENAQVYNSIIQTLEQISFLIDGDTSLRDFSKILKEGFSAQTINVIPPTTDQIIVGNVQKVATRDVENLIVLGINEGAMPRLANDNYIISDAEAKELQKIGINSFSQSKEYMQYQKLLVYKCLMKAKKSLYLSYANSDSKGKKLEPSYLINRLRNIFNDIDIKEIEGNRLVSKKQGYYQLALSLRDFIDNSEDSENLRTLYASYRQEQDQQLLDKIEDALFYQPIGFSKANARMLMQNKNYSSITRVEQFNSCPYKHFINYAIKPKSLKKYNEDRIDQGNYYHDAFNLLTRELINKGLEYETYSQQQIENMLDEILNEIETYHNYALLKSTPKFKQLAKFMRSTAKKTMWAMINHILAGKFRPYLAEAKIGTDVPYVNLQLDNGEMISLQGKIDRIDIFECENKKYVRVIDYKTSKKDIDYTNIYNGLSLQLPVYLNSIKSIGEVAGMYYMQISDPVYDIEKYLKNKINIIEPFKLEGVMVDLRELAVATDENNYENSFVANIKVNKKGELSKGVLDKDKMNSLIDFAVRKTKETIHRIMQGENLPYPSKLAAQNACEYCQFRSICRFEPKRHCKANELVKIKEDEFFERIAIEVNEDDKMD